MFVYIMYYFVPRRIFADDTVSDIVAHSHTSEPIENVVVCTN